MSVILNVFGCLVSFVMVGSGLALILSSIISIRDHMKEGSPRYVALWLWGSAFSVAITGGGMLLFSFALSNLIGSQFLLNVMWSLGVIVILSAVTIATATTISAISLIREGLWDSSYVSLPSGSGLAPSYGRPFRGGPDPRS